MAVSLPSQTVSARKRPAVEELAPFQTNQPEGGPESEWSLSSCGETIFTETSQRPDLGPGQFYIIRCYQKVMNTFLPNVPELIEAGIENSPFATFPRACDIS